MVLNRYSHMQYKRNARYTIPTARWVSNPTVQGPVAAMATNLGWDTRMFGADAAGA